MDSKTQSADPYRVKGIQPLPWDRYDVYLFDVDDTLLHCADAVHYYAFCDALESLSGRKLTLDGVTAHGNTDAGILREALILAGVPERLWRPQIAIACAAMCAQVQSQQHTLNVSALPGVIPLLDYLRSLGALLGVATGNLEVIGRLKLERCGLIDYFEFGAYSDGFERRIDVFAHALSIVRSIAGANTRSCVIGDTPADIQAAHKNDMSIIAVASGVYSFDALAAEHPELCVTSLEELSPFRPLSALHSDQESPRTPSRDA